MKTTLSAICLVLSMLAPAAHAQNIEQTADFIHNFFALVDKKCPFMDYPESQLNAKIVGQFGLTSSRFSEALARANLRASAVACDSNATFQGQQWYRSELKRIGQAN